MPKLLVKLKNFVYIVIQLDCLQIIKLLKPQVIKEKPWK